jgi:arylsulfatase A-like enzyme
MDEAIGRILTALEETGQGQNTLVIFAADHGLAMGSHGLLGKQSLYQHSMGLPLILRGPNIPADQSSNALVYLLDVFPTILEAANLPLADDLQAHSLWPLVDDSQQSLRETLFTSLGRHQRAIRDDRWKLIRYPEIDHLQLFDLQADPDERENLAARPEHAGTISRLRRSLGQWQEYVGDDVPWTAKKVRDKEIDLTGASRKPDRWQPEWVRKKYFGE